MFKKDVFKWNKYREELLGWLVECGGGLYYERKGEEFALFSLGSEGIGLLSIKK